MGAIDPLGDRRVILVGNQQRQAEVVQQAFAGPFPVALVVAHLQQLAGKRHGLFREAQRLAQRAAHRHLRGRDVAAPRLEAVDLGHQLIVLLLALAQADAQLGELVLQACIALARGFGQHGEALALVEKAGFVRRGLLANRAEQLAVALCLARSRLALQFEAMNVGRQTLEPVAAVLGDAALQLALLGALRQALLVDAPELGVLPPPVFSQAGQPLVEQAELEAGEIGFERFATGAHVLDLRHQQRMPLAVGHQRREQRHLPLGLEHCFMGAVEVVEVADQGRDSRPDVERLEHVAAHEIGQVADRFHRHRLMEEVQRLFVVDAEAPPEPGAVRRKAVENFGQRPPQPLAQRGDVRAEVRKIAGNRQLAFGDDEEACRLPLRVLDPEHLRQRHRLVVAGVMKHAEDHRVVVVVAQRHRSRRAADLVALGLVVAEDVGAQRPLATVGTRRLVVGDALRRHQQGGHRIDQRRLARPDVAGEQRVLAARVERPHARVESAPVEDFQALQAKTGKRVVGDEIKPEALRLIHRRRPWYSYSAYSAYSSCSSLRRHSPPPIASDRRPGADRIRPATARRRRT
jgi:hypothetical protein